MTQSSLSAGRSYRRLLVAVVCSLALAGAGAGSASAQSAAGWRVAVLAQSIKFADTHLGSAPHNVRLAVAKGLVGLARFLLAPQAHPDPFAPTTTTTTAPRTASTPAAVPGTVVGGLILDAYCQGKGFDHSQVNGPILAPGAAYQWICVSASGSQTPIFMQDACSVQYPNQGSIAYPQDINNAYSWICIAPTTGTTTTSTQTTYSLQAGPDGSAVLIITSDGSSYLSVQTPTTGGTVQINPDGSGYIAENGAGGTLPI